MMLLLTLTIFPTNSFAINEKVPTSSSNPKEVPAEVKLLLNRLE
jgi:hypothetical protein